MKKIDLETVKMMMGEPVPQEVNLDYREQIMSLLLIPMDPQGGTNYEEMAVVLPIHAKFKSCDKGYIVLEDAEHEETVKRLKNAKFRQNTPEIYEMIRSVDDAPDYNLSEVPNAEHN